MWPQKGEVPDGSAMLPDVFDKLRCPIFLSLIYLNVHANFKKRPCHMSLPILSHVTKPYVICQSYEMPMSLCRFEGSKAIKVETAVGCPGGLHYPCSYPRGSKVGMQGRALPPPCPPPPLLVVFIFYQRPKRKWLPPLKGLPAALSAILIMTTNITKRNQRHVHAPNSTT